MKLRNALLAATVLAAPVVAKAQPVDGVYVAGGAGGSIMQNKSLDRLGFPQVGTSVNLNNLPNGNNGEKRFGSDFLVLGSAGYGFGNGLRVELEGSYRQNPLDRIGVGNGNAINGSFARIPGTDARGDEQKYGAFVNALYDFDVTPYGIPYIQPYVGVGVGYVHVMNQNQSVTGPATGGGTFLLRPKGEDDNLGYQAIIGAAVPLPTVMPGLALTVEYRFMGLAFDDTVNGQYFSPATPRGTRVKERTSDDYNHDFLLGFRYAFNQAPPPPPPAPVPVAAPAPTPARTYLVFFDWDRADITPRARQIISEAAQASTRVQSTRIQVNGYTDLSGTRQYNQRLSVRRAQSVAAELVRDGVARNEISIQGFGESNPLVPTAQGVREPQNRRVEIILQ